MTEPVDILAIASRHLEAARYAVRSAMMMQQSVTTQEWYDRAWTQYLIASDDLNAVQSLVRDLARESPPP